MTLASISKYLFSMHGRIHRCGFLARIGLTITLAIGGCALLTLAWPAYRANPGAPNFYGFVGAVSLISAMICLSAGIVRRGRDMGLAVWASFLVFIIVPSVPAMLFPGRGEIFSSMLQFACFILLAVAPASREGNVEDHRNDQG